MPTPKPAQSRKDKLARKLKENLKRRKAQARALSNEAAGVVLSGKPLGQSATKKAKKDEPQGG